MMSIMNQKRKNPLKMRKTTIKNLNYINIYDKIKYK